MKMQRAPERPHDAAWRRAEKIAPESVLRENLGVLLGTEVALIVDAFLARAALVVIPVWRGVGCGPILRRGVVGWLRRRAATRTAAHFALLSVARGAPQGWVSHVMPPTKGRRAPQAGISTN